MKGEESEALYAAQKRLVKAMTKYGFPSETEISGKFIKRGTMAELTIKLQIQDDDILGKVEEHRTNLPGDANVEYAANWLMYWLSSELKVENTWLDYLQKLPDPRSVEVDVLKVRFDLTGGAEPYYDRMNSGKAWFEAYNQLLAARNHLARARAYKALEPEHPTNEMHVLHERKMGEFHHAVRNIKKIEDMILRLVFEALGASLKDVDHKTGQPAEIVDVSSDEWERKLTLDKVKPALKQREINARLKAMSEVEYQELRAIVSALNHRATKKLWDFWQYRHRLEHRMPQSVDYAYLYPMYEDRPKPVAQDQGRRVMVGSIGSMPTKPERSFEELYEIAKSVYQYYVSLLERLDKLPTFSRPK